MEMAPPDPILGVNELFQNDSNPGKVNLTLGIYLDETGNCPVLSSVKQAGKMLLERETTKQYLGIAGEAHFGKLAREQLFGVEHPVILENRCTTVVAPFRSSTNRVL